VQRAEIAESSGFDVLDETAIETSAAAGALCRRAYLALRSKLGAGSDSLRR